MRDYAVLSQALLSGASAQLRNMATTGGNLLQRTRCVYFRDTAMPATSATPGSGCSAIGGFNRMLAILGTSEHCIATNPSDMNVALDGARSDGASCTRITGRTQHPDRAISISCREQTPHTRRSLEPGDLMTSCHLAAAAARRERSIYLKLRDRASYEFALVSAAVVAEVGDGTIRTGTHRIGRSRHQTLARSEA